MSKNVPNLGRAFPIIRIDFPLDTEEPEHSVKIVRVYFDEEVAKSEVDRLNSVNAEKGCKYYYDMCKAVPKTTPSD